MSKAEKNEADLKLGVVLPPLALPATDGGTIDLAALPGRSLVMVPLDRVSGSSQSAQLG